MNASKLAFVEVYCCELSDTSSVTDAVPFRHDGNGGEMHPAAPSSKLPASVAMYVAFTTHAPQLHAVPQAPHESKRHL